MIHEGFFVFLVIFVVINFLANFGSVDCSINGLIPNPSPNSDVKAPEKYQVSFLTNVQINGFAANPIVLEVIRAWAPLGADRFYSLVKDGYYNVAAFFRVVPNFVLQFGIAAEPAETSKWDTIIHDDPVIVSNTNWTVSYATAGPETRTTQLFINYIDNSRLDDMGFAPFAKVISGWETALQVVNPTPGDSDGVDQDEYTALGNDWILQKYPTISMITCTTIDEVI
jgi:peptidyl-prolyl cis-trans isomerase A (cyclophilin A)